jgi:hypothetical protein
MYKVFLKVILFVVLFFYFPVKSKAWGMLGHRVVGEIASTYLTPKARVQIAKILGTESIAIASNYADFIKSDTTYRYLNPWHYIDFESNLSSVEMNNYLKKDTATNAYTRINFIVRELKNKNLQQEKKVFYLKLLIHLVGDIHQPLHASPEGTSGGNTIKVTWFGQPSSLHRVWDEQLPEYQQLSYTEYTAAINHSTLKQRTRWQKQPLSDWLFESYYISQQLIDELKQPEIKLSYQYNFNHVKTMNEQLLKGGVRLAGLLNQIFG